MAKRKPRSKPQLPQEFLERLKSVKNKRARVVIDHILKHGHITTEELKDRYGYDHPPRAARDVREQGIPLETFKLKGAHGRQIAAYRFGNPAAIRAGRLGGRVTSPKDLKAGLAARDGARCAVCHAEFELRYLQIDHRVPYEVSGDEGRTPQAEDLMLLCGSCNRAKSWSCEHCRNWSIDRNVDTCRSCYWASPKSYSHVALVQIRRLDITWSGAETVDYDAVAGQAASEHVELPAFVKRVLKKSLRRG